jgi:hypothetical protein
MTDETPSEGTADASSDKREADAIDDFNHPPKIKRSYKLGAAIVMPARMNQHSRSF